MVTPNPAFVPHDLGDGLSFRTGRLPQNLEWDEAKFGWAWALHPAERPSILMHGRSVTIPGWQQAFGADYHFSVSVRCGA